MMCIPVTALALVFVFVPGALARPNFKLGPHNAAREAAASPLNKVSINGPDNYCMIVPKDAHTDIGDSEYDGGTTTYCSSKARGLYAAGSAPPQGEFPPGFWRAVDWVTATGVNGVRYTQLTGCIDAALVDRFNPADEGGQYDSSGGREGVGNPQYSQCTGYKHYVELIEPSVGRACIRCCDDPDDCPTKLDTEGCPAVIPGNYFGCQ